MESPAKYAKARGPATRDSQGHSEMVMPPEARLYFVSLKADKSYGRVNHEQELSRHLSMELPRYS